MKLILTTDDGEVLDTTDVTAAEFTREVERNPHSVLAALNPGSDAILAELRKALG